MLIICLAYLKKQQVKYQKQTGFDLHIYGKTIENLSKYKESSIMADQKKKTKARVAKKRKAAIAAKRKLLKLKTKKQKIN